MAIRLSTCSARIHNQVRYDLTCGAYRRVAAADEDLTLDLLTLPSRVIHRDLHDEIQQQQQQKQSKKTEEGKTAKYSTVLEQLGAASSGFFSVFVSAL